MASTRGEHQPVGGLVLDQHEVARLLRHVREGGLDAVPRTLQHVAVTAAVIAALAVLVILVRVPNDGWTELARGPDTAWEAAARANPEGTAFRLRGIGFFESATLVLAEPGAAGAVDASLLVVNGEVVLVGVAAADTDAVRLVGAAGEARLLDPVEVPGGGRAFAVAAMELGEGRQGLRLEALDEQGRMLGSHVPMPHRQD